MFGQAAAAAVGGGGGVTNRVALVSGASRGIGLSTVQLLLARGAAHVVGVARNIEPLQQLILEQGRQETHDVRQGRLHAIAADLSHPEECRRVVHETLQLGDQSNSNNDNSNQRNNNLDIVVVNHGIGIAHETPIHLQHDDDTTDAFAYSMNVNLTSAYHLTRATLPHMVQQGYGRVVYTSSTAAWHGEPSGVGYNTSKAALCGLMRSVSVDAGMAAAANGHGGDSNITANAVLPGWVRTELAERSATVEAAARGISVDQVWRERAAIYPPQRVLTPLEVANVIVFLASEESRGVSGESIRVALGGYW